MQFKIVKVEDPSEKAKNGRWIIVYHTVIAGRVQVAEVSNKTYVLNDERLEATAKKRAAQLERAFIAVRAPTT